MIKNDNAADKRRKKLILDVIRNKNYVPMRASEIAVLLNIPKPKKKDLYKILDQLKEEGQIVCNENGRYEKTSGTAAAGLKKDRNRRENVREERGRKENRERQDRTERSAFGQRKGRDRFGRGAAEKGGKGQKILPSGSTRPEGNNVEEILLSAEIPTEFPDKVMKQAEKIPMHIRQEELSGRTDLRGLTTITIDGEDSRDFDDAVSLERDGSGYILGIHIADVTAYVPASSALDKEALKRGTSVYLPERVIPMLPERLSNGICSLNEGEDRLTLSCIVRMDKNGTIRGSKIVESVICSAHRMTYNEVQKLFDEKDPELMDRYADVVPMLFSMRELAHTLEQKRHNRGMLDFEFPESKILVDENGRPVQLCAKMPTESTRLIEHFMLTANEVVAKTFFDRQIPFVYRTHEHPDEERIEDTLTILRSMGFAVEKKEHQISPLELQKVLEQAKESDAENMIGTMILRSMKQARYSTVNSGHFGLASKYYCHFTSPIRRYPDLQIHRIIKNAIHGRVEGRKKGFYEKILDDVAWKSSALERRAAETEREVKKLLMAEYASEHLGEETDGVITGVTAWGFYVQRPDTMEGLVPCGSLHDDFYEFDEHTMTLAGKRRGRVFAIGQNVRIKIVRADKERRIIDFALLEDEVKGEE
ncbi:MAG: ribonuclease R [Eubacteriales bacterium]|nr:ribonuclease R [Eubacteriales bacterium]